MIRAFHLVGGADAINYGAYSPYSLCYLWMSKVKVPGVDLPDDAMWQVVERELNKCILATDGETDLFRAKEILGDRMCLMGDVPAAMLAFGTPDEVFEYSTKLIRELGPKGFILHSGCDIPTNAKLENVQAMLAAAIGK